jgi:hypothetical protein
LLKSSLEMLRFFEFEVLLEKINFPLHHPPRRRIYSDTAPRGGMASDARGSTAPQNTRPIRAAKIRRPAGSVGIHTPQEPLWRASTLRRSTLAAVHAPQEQVWRASTHRRSKFSPVHPPPRRRET